jgi:hypothetical protein
MAALNASTQPQHAACRCTRKATIVESGSGILCRFSFENTRLEGRICFDSRKKTTKPGGGDRPGFDPTSTKHLAALMAISAGVVSAVIIAAMVGPMIARVSTISVGAVSVVGIAADVRAEGDAARVIAAPATIITRPAVSVRSIIRPTIAVHRVAR